MGTYISLDIMNYTTFLVHPPKTSTKNNRLRCTTNNVHPHVQISAHKCLLQIKNFLLIEPTTTRVTYSKIAQLRVTLIAIHPLLMIKKC